MTLLAYCRRLGESGRPPRPRSLRPPRRRARGALADASARALQLAELLAGPVDRPRRRGRLYLPLDDAGAPRPATAEASRRGEDSPALRAVPGVRGAPRARPARAGLRLARPGRRRGSRREVRLFARGWARDPAQDRGRRTTTCWRAARRCRAASDVARLVLEGAAGRATADARPYAQRTSYCAAVTRRSALALLRGVPAPAARSGGAAPVRRLRLLPLRRRRRRRRHGRATPQRCSRAGARSSTRSTPARRRTRSASRSPTRSARFPLAARHFDDLITGVEMDLTPPALRDLRASSPTTATASPPPSGCSCIEIFGYAHPSARGLRASTSASPSSSPTSCATCARTPSAAASTCRSRTCVASTCTRPTCSSGRWSPQVGGAPGLRVRAGARLLSARPRLAGRRRTAPRSPPPRRCGGSTQRLLDRIEARQLRRLRAAHHARAPREGRARAARLGARAARRAWRMTDVVVVGGGFAGLAAGAALAAAGASVTVLEAPPAPGRSRALLPRRRDGYDRRQRPARDDGLLRGDPGVPGSHRGVAESSAASMPCASRCTTPGGDAGCSHARGCRVPSTCCPRVCRYRLLTPADRLRALAGGSRILAWHRRRDARLAGLTVEELLDAVGQPAASGGRSGTRSRSRR